MRTNRKPQSTPALIEANMDYATRLAHQFFRERQNMGIELEDFIGAAFLGLCDAATRFDPEKGQNFKTYSFFRIRGSMYDLLRRNGGISRTHFSELISNQNSEAPQHSGQEAKLPYAFARDMSDLMQLSSLLEEFGVRVHPCSERERVDISYSYARTPETDAALLCSGKYLHSILSELPGKQRELLHYKYFEHKTFDEIREEHNGMSKSWLSRLHTRALRSLREKMQRDGTFDELREDCREG